MAARTSATTAPAPARNPVLLLPSLQTCCGMVEGNGKPARRPLSAIDMPACFQSMQSSQQWIPHPLNLPRLPTTTPGYCVPFNHLHHLTTLSPEVMELVTQHIESRSIPRYFPVPDDTRIVHNILSCCNPDASLDMLKSFIRAKKRLDIEQAAALVVAALGTSHARSLLPHLTCIFASAEMWLQPKDLTNGKTTRERVLSNNISKILHILKSYIPDDIATLDPTTTTFSHILPFLLRIRRTKPSDRCLRIPPWVFTSCNTSPPPPFNNPPASLHAVWPAHPIPDAITLSKHHFRIIDVLLNHLSYSMKPAKVLLRDIQSLSDHVTFGLVHMDTLLRTTDLPSLCFCFFALQRRMQPKVVTDTACGRFLKKGELSVHQQNTPHVPTTFEDALLQVAKSRPAEQVDWDALTAVTIPKGLEALSTVYSKEGKILEAMDKACLLGENYVVVHGQGEFERLVFKKGEVGGSGRGPVDQYNRLVDVIRDVKKMWVAAGSMDGIEMEEEEEEDNEVDAARNGPGKQGAAAGAAAAGCKAAAIALEDITADLEANPAKVVGPCHKFLAKDIMAYLKSWGDDAFAGGKRPGWMAWLKLRRLQGAIPPAQVQLV